MRIAYPPTRGAYRTRGAAKSRSDGVLPQRALLVAAPLHATGHDAHLPRRLRTRRRAGHDRAVRSEHAAVPRADDAVVLEFAVVQRAATVRAPVGESDDRALGAEQHERHPVD